MKIAGTSKHENMLKAQSDEKKLQHRKPLESIPNKQQEISAEKRVKLIPNRKSEQSNIKTLEGILENSSDSDALNDRIDAAAKRLGGFFEKHGLLGETERIYNSIMGSINKIEQENIEGNSYYTVDEIVKAYNTMLEVEKYSIDSVNGRDITANSSEQEVGLKLGELKLKAAAFEKYGGASTVMNDSIMNVVDRFIETTAESLRQIKEQIQKDMLEPQKLPGFNKDEVFDVISNVVQAYESTGSMVGALKKGSAFAMNQYTMKNSSSTGAEKPVGADYWASFNKERKEKYLRLGEYHKEKTGFDELADAWNDYAVMLNKDEAELFERGSGRYV